MSVILLDYDVDMVTLTLQKKDGTGSTSWNLATEYFAASALDSRPNAVVYPVLASVPQVKRGVGNVMANRYDVTLEIYSKTHFQEYGKGFVDVLGQYDLHNGTATIYYFPKSLDAAATYASTNIRQTLTVIAIDYDDSADTLTVQCRDSWFKDRPFGNRMWEYLWGSNISYYYNNWWSEQAPVPFGSDAAGTEGVVVSSAPVIDSILQTGGSGGAVYQQVRILASVTANNGTAFASSFENLYVRNPWKQLEPKEWLKCDLGNTLHFFSAALAGPSTLIDATAFSGKQWRIGRKYTPPTGKAQMIGGVRCRWRRQGTIAAGGGTLSVKIAKLRAAGTSNYVIEGNTMYEAIYDASSVSTAAANYDVYFNPPAILPAGSDYIVYQEWSNNTDAGNYIEFRYDGGTPGDPCLTNDQTVNKDGWAETAAQAQMQLFQFGTNGAIQGIDTTAGDSTYWFLEIHNYARGTNPATFNGVDFKIGVSGILDDSSGTFTGSASALISNPADIARLVLMQANMGIGLSSGEVDTSAFDTARTALLAKYYCCFAIEGQISCEELLRKLCRQARMILYKKRDGKITIKVPTYPSSTDYTIGEGFWRDELKVINVVDMDYSNIVNHFEGVFNYDALQQNTDPALLRISRDQKFLGLEFTYSSLMGFNAADDYWRRYKTYESQLLYGFRPLVERFDLYEDWIPARNALNYIQDRNSYAEKRISFKLPRHKWYTLLDLFSNVRVQAVAIHDLMGTAEETKVHDAGTPITVRVSGIPMASYAGGILEVQIVEMAEEGAWITCVGETLHGWAT